MRATLSALAILAATATGLFGGEPKPKPEAAPQRPQRTISLKEIVELALRRNLVLAAEKINPKRAHTVIVEQSAIFDPTAYSQATRAKSKSQQASSYLS